MDQEDQSKLKQQASIPINSGLAVLTSKLVGTGADSAAVTISSLLNVADTSASSGLSEHKNNLGTEANNPTKNNNTLAIGGPHFSSNEVDEDGYSLQPPKEVAWDENKETGMMRKECLQNNANILCFFQLAVFTLIQTQIRTTIDLKSAYM